MVHNAKAFSSKVWITVGVVGLLFLLAFAFVREYVRNMDIALELERMQAENEALNTERLVSLELISQLSTETAVEDGARTKLNLAAEGETMYVIADEQTTDTIEGEVPAADEVRIAAVAEDPALSNPAKWFYYFFAPDSSQETGAL